MINDLSIESLDKIGFDHIVKVNYSEETIKKNFQILIKYLRNLKDSQKVSQQQIDTLQNQMQRQMQENEILQKKAQQFENFQVDIKNQIKNEIMNQLKHNQNEICQLKGENHKLNEELTNCKAKIERLRDLLAIMKDKVDQLGNTDQLEHRFNQKLEQRFVFLQEMQRQISELWLKVNCLQQKNEISKKGQFDLMFTDLNDLKTKIYLLNQQPIPEEEKKEIVKIIQGEKSNEKDSDKLSEIEQKVVQIVCGFNQILKPKKNNKLVKQIEEEIKNIEKTSFKPTLDEKIVQKQIQIQELKRLFSNYQEFVFKKADGSDDSSLQQLEEKLSQMKKETIAVLKQLKEELQNKINKDDLEKFEEYMNNKFAEIDALYNNKFANKQEIREQIECLEKKIQALTSIVKNLQKQQESVAVRRPLWSCLACDRVQQNYTAKLGKHKPTNLFPLPKDVSPEKACGNFAKGYRNMMDNSKYRNASIYYQSTTSGLNENALNNSQTGDAFADKLPNLHNINNNCVNSNNENNSSTKMNSKLINVSTFI